jgi:hypothetical protein
MVFASLMYFDENRLGSAPADSGIPARHGQARRGGPRIALFGIVRQEHGWTPCMANGYSAEHFLDFARSCQDYGVRDPVVRVLDLLYPAMR